MPRERARSQATRSVASATMRDSYGCRGRGGGAGSVIVSPSRSKRANGVSSTGRAYCPGRSSTRPLAGLDGGRMSLLSRRATNAERGSVRDAPVVRDAARVQLGDRLVDRAVPRGVGVAGVED